MFWADELAASLSGPQVVNDSKTPSGHRPRGQPARRRAPRRHRARDRVTTGGQTEFRYGVDDLDPMDAQALLTPDAVDRYMGVPLAHVPAPEGSTAELCALLRRRAVHGHVRRPRHPARRSTG